MDPGQAIVAIAGMVTGLLTTGLIVWAVVQGLRARYKGGSLPPQVEGELAALREQVDGLHQALIETQERLDFTERLLAQPRAPEQLPRG